MLSEGFAANLATLPVLQHRCRLTNDQYVPWDGWHGWEMHGGLLFPPGYSRNGIAPGEFFAIVYYRQAVSAYRERLEQLEAQLRALKAKKRRATKLVVSWVRLGMLMSSGCRARREPVGPPGAAEAQGR